MHWGNINTSNYYDNINAVPLKVWDRLQSMINPLSDKLLGLYGINSAVRGDKPIEIKTNMDFSMQNDILGQILNGNEPGIILSVGKKTVSNPFSESPYYAEVLEDDTGVTLINRYPSYARNVSLQIEEVLEQNNMINHFTHVAKGLCLVSYPTNYYTQIEDIPHKELTKTLESLQIATSKTIDEAIMKGIEYIPLRVFVNTGPLSGRSLSRAHIQTYIDTTEDGHDTRTEARIKAYEHDSLQGYGCPICKRADDTIRLENEPDKGDFGNKLVYENDSWCVWIPGCPEHNYQIRFGPKEHKKDITELNSEEINGLSDVLIKVSNGLNELGIERDRNILFHQLPAGYTSFFHMYGDIIPFDNIGGIERMEHMRVNKTSIPEYVEQMKEVLR
ncbi:MAG: hypothetical protein ACOC2U_02240 [bacterium]